LEVLPFVCVLAGVGVASLASRVARLVKAESRTARDLEALVGAALSIVVWMAIVSAVSNEDLTDPLLYGFGYINRGEVSDLGNAIRVNSAADDLVIAPSFAAFQANRATLVRFPETYGVYRAALDEISARGFSAARADAAETGFGTMIHDTFKYSVAAMTD